MSTFGRRMCLVSLLKSGFNLLVQIFENRGGIVRRGGSGDCCAEQRCEHQQETHFGKFKAA
jgi:hypothetical protein